jgi:glutamyl/glutaminyl-tRNA synthetase
VHLPLIKAMNGKKLAKRDPESQVNFFKAKEYEVEAIKNYIFQLGLTRSENENNL